MNRKSDKIGLVTTISLVIGNMVGAGIYVLPAALAGYGSVSILGWIFTAAGALILAKIFGNFSKIVVNKSGGPYAFSKAGFGNFIGFLVAWGYWISIWISNAAIAIAFIAAMSYFFPLLTESSLASVTTGLSSIWLLTYVNSRGVKESGIFQLVTTILKIAPLIFVAFFGLFFFDINNFPEFNLSLKSNVGAFSAVTALTLYAFVGVESASIPAENVELPEQTIPRATMIGTLITTVVYVLGTVVLFGIIPIAELSDSPAPFAEAARLIGGEGFGSFVAAGAAISAIGALNGWILISGQIPMATARDGLFPSIFKKTNGKGVPVLGLIIGSILSSLLMLFNFTGGLVEQFQFMVNLTVLACLVPYVFVSAAYVLVKLKRSYSFKMRIIHLVLGIAGFLYSLWAIYGSGSETVFYGFLMLLLGIPLYVWMQYKD